MRSRHIPSLLVSMLLFSCAGDSRNAGPSIRFDPPDEIAIVPFLQKKEEDPDKYWMRFYTIRGQFRPVIVAKDERGGVKSADDIVADFTKGLSELSNPGVRLSYVPVLVSGKTFRHYHIPTDRSENVSFVKSFDVFIWADDRRFLFLMFGTGQDEGYPEDVIKKVLGGISID